MNGGEVVLCADNSACGKPFEVMRDEYPGPFNCPYCGTRSGPAVK